METDAFVDKLGELAEKHEGLAVLVGLVGNGSKRGRLRLYLRPQLDWYVEFAAKAVVHREELPPEASSIGGSMLWVVPGTKLTEVTDGPLAQQAQLLRGDLVEFGGTDPDAVHAAALPATVTLSSLPCGTVVVATTITIASYLICTTSVNTPPLTSALQHQQCVTTNATVICHPQTKTMGTWGSVGCPEPKPDDGDPPIS